MAKEPTSAEFPFQEPGSREDPWPAKPDPYKIGNESEGGLTKTNTPPSRLEESGI